ncbi:MAG TPA: sensor histidine kinase [Spirochaetia bacterium]|nr:sensor histidine kinase [Spirochaetales bacterium]HRY78911.1 sensor histidine kinase [Spirochaetia bacterium]HRZ89966.1 sensor histidine kinase [Spirochaetia bacterium]
MDPRTIALLMLISGVECSLLFFASGIFRKRTDGGAGRPSLFWGAGTTVHVLGVLGLMTQGIVGPWFSVVFANSAIILGQLLILVGIRRLTAINPALPRYASAWLLYSAAAVVFTFVLPSTTVRIILFSAAISAFYIEAAILVLISKSWKREPLTVYLTGTFLAMAGFFAARALVTVFVSPASIFSPSAMNLATYIVSHVGLIGWSLGLILLQQRRTEADLERALREKEVLFRELQHRIKNSISVIASLVSLEASRVEDPGASAVLEGLEGRISAIASLYEHLFQSGQTDHVDLDLYLKAVVETLFSGQAARERGVRLNLEAQELRIDVRRAIPLGIIANELASDCLKHAFPEGRSGTVRVSLRAEGPSAVLEVRDDGKGLPEGFTIGSSEGLGLVLVDMLAKQVGGSFTAASEGGSVFTVKFPKEWKS